LLGSTFAEKGGQAWIDSSHAPALWQVFYFTAATMAATMAATEGGDGATALQIAFHLRSSIFDPRLLVLAREAGYD